MEVAVVVLLGLGGLIAVALAKLVILRVVDGRHVAQTWSSLEVEEKEGVFSEALVADLPGPAQRYFCHTIRPGSPLYSWGTLRMSGKIKPGQNSPWMPFTAKQILTPHWGFVWKARASIGLLFLDAADHYARGRGRMRIALFGLVPVVNATGPDLSRSALGRLLAESILVPSALLPQWGVTWVAEDDNHINATLSSSGEAATLNLTVNDKGGLQEMSLQRYGNQTETGQWAYIPFGVAVDGESTFDGYTIPSRFRAGWWYGTERYRESFQVSIEQVVFG